MKRSQLRIADVTMDGDGAMGSPDPPFGNSVRFRRREVFFCIA